MIGFGKKKSKTKVKTPAGFWRRNAWGLLGVLPATALFAIAGLDRSDYFDSQLNGRPRDAISGAPADWVAFSGARLRLLGLSTTADLYDTNAKSLKLPAELKAWKAVIEIQVDDQRTLTDCELSLEDSAGRLFGARPDELATARIPVPTCTAEDQVLNTYQVTVFFIAPADAKPVAVRVVRRAALPGYARLVAA